MARPKLLLALADRALATTTQDTDYWAWFCLCKSMALYRTEDLPGCIQWAEKCRKYEWDTPPRSAAAEFLLAMAHHRLNQTAQAIEAYERAEHRFGTDIPEIASGYIGGQGIDNWLVCQTLRREARSLLFPGPATRPAKET